MYMPSIFTTNFVDDMFDDMFRTPWGLTTTGANAPSGAMSADVQEFDNRYQLDIELPGYKKEDIHAELKDGYLTISAERKEDKDEKDNDGKYIRRERYFGQSQRSFYVGEAVKQEDIHAAFENGILKLEIPKVKEQPKVEEKKFIAIE